MSEQEFAASLDASPQKPQFEIDEVTHPAEHQAVDEVAGLECLNGPASESVSPLLPPGPPSQGDRGPAECSEKPGPGPDWRSLVSAKVSNYKARKPQKDRYPSLKLQFEPPPRSSRPLQTFAPVEELGSRLEESEEIASEPRQLSPPPLPDPAPRVVMEATARVIEFPRPAYREDELAEPVMDRPRIVEAPELLPPPPAMGGILIEEQREQEPERRPGFDVPLQPASLNRRIAAGLMDVTVVLAALASFGCVFLRISGSMPPIRLATMTAGALMAVLWAAYQYAFLVYCGKTPGLWAAKLNLAKFDGQRVSRNRRRWRVLASVLSLGSLGLGYAWTFLDEDQLSWHDRITKTHLAPN